MRRLEMQLREERRHSHSFRSFSSTGLDSPYVSDGEASNDPRCGPATPRMNVGTTKEYQKTDLFQSIRKADMYIYCACSGGMGQCSATTHVSRVEGCCLHDPNG